MTPRRNPEDPAVQATLPEDVPLRASLVGQEALFRQLDRAVESGRLAHSYLFLGPEGAGRTRAAIAFAQDLLARPNGEAESPSARKKVAHLVHPDFHLVYPMLREEAQKPEKVAQRKAEYATHRFASLVESDTATIGIDQIRALKNETSMAMVEGPRRVVVFSRADRMTEPAAQSSLKLIEEPPPATVLILTATDAGQLLPTIVSRCQRARVRALAPAVILEVLVEQLHIEPAEARLLAALSGGSLGRAVALRRENVLEVRLRGLELFRNPGRDPARIAKRVESAGRDWNPASARQIVDLLLMWYHDVLLIRHGLDPEQLVHADLRKQIERAAQQLTVDEIRRRIRILEELMESIGQWVNPASSLFAALTLLGSGAEAGDLHYLGS